MRLSKDTGLCVAAAAAALLLGVAVVWVNIERMDLAYRLEQIEARQADTMDLRAKLQLERDNLASPYRLRKKAEELGMRPAQPGQLRQAPPARSQDAGPDVLL